MTGMQNESLTGFLLSAQQRWIWRRRQRCSVPCAQGAIRVEGAIDQEALRLALGAIVARHEILRTTFRSVDGLAYPLQNVDPTPVFQWDECHLDDEAAIEGLCSGELERPFDLERGPALHACIARVRPQVHVVVMTLPAVCADAWTLRNIFRELTSAYGAAVERGGLLERSEPLQYLQFSAWQDSLASSEDAQPAREFWRAQAAAANVGPLKFAFESASARAENAIARTFRLDAGPEVIRRVKALATQHAVSEETVVLTSWHEVLRRATAAETPATWVTLTGRTHDVLVDACGPFATAIPVRSQLRRGEPFQADLVRLHKTLGTAEEWLPHYRPDEDATTCSDLRSGFEYVSMPDACWQGAVRFSLVCAFDGVMDVDLNLRCLSWRDSMSLEYTYNSGRFGAAYIRTLAECLRTFLERIDGDMPADVIEIQSDDSRRGFLTATSDTALEVRAPWLLHERFERQAASTPDRLALVGERETVTFADVNRRANGIAHHLLTLGVGPEDAVAICMERSNEMIIAILAILKAGCAYVPLDSTFPADRIRRILADTNARIVVTQPALQDVLPTRDIRVVLVDADTAAAGADDRNPECKGHPDNLAYIIYTSGSTGAPKGVQVSHRSVINLLHALRHRIYASMSGPRRVGLNAPIVFDASVKQWIQILEGHTLAVIPEERRLDPSALAAFLRDHRVDVLDCTPFQLKHLLGSPAFTLDGETSLQCVLVGGEAIDAQLWALLAASSRIAFYNVYGPTECTVDATIAAISGAPEPTIGRPIANGRVYVLDEHFRPVPPGMPGELHIGGAGVARGYRNRPELTAERFIPDPFTGSPGARLYRTGDIVCVLADGQLKYLGRRDDQIKLRGYRVELGEIAAVLREADEVRDAVAVLRSGSDRHRDPTLAAYVIPQAGATIDRDRLRRHLRQHVPEYMIPSAFVTLARFPLTVNGKVDVTQLPEPDGDGRAAAQTYAAPRSDAERVIAQIWREVLGVQKVGLDDNFFDLGGHSLPMVQVYARLRETFDRDIRMVELFRRPTIAMLSQYFNGAADDAAAARHSSDRAAKRIAAAARVTNVRGEGRR